jgi:arylsulfatase A-like enzyme
MRSIGPATADAGSPAALDRAAVDAFLKVGIPRVNPSVTVIWLGALDSTAHANGIGAPATIEILQQVDREIGRVQQGLSAAGLLDRYNVWVTSDHGFSTHTGGVDLDPILKPFAGTLPDQSPRIVSGGGAIYVRDGDQAAIAQIAGLLQKTPGVGAIFTRSAQPGILDGSVPGTLSFDAARWTHERAAQILFSPDWTDAPNAYGMRGTVASGGVAGHGSSSIWDIHNTLIAAGPNLRQGVTLDVPSANVDFAPTFLKLLEIPIPASMQGRSLEEALAGGTTSGSPAVRTIEHTAVTPDRSYSVTATFSIVSAGGKDYRYLDGTKVVRQ